MYPSSQASPTSCYNLTVLSCAGHPVLLWGWFPWHQSVPAGGIDIWALGAGPCHHHWQTQVGVVLISSRVSTVHYIYWPYCSLQYNTGGTWLWCKYYCVWRHKDPGWPLTFKLWPLGYLYYGVSPIFHYVIFDLWLIRTTLIVVYRLGERVWSRLELNWTQSSSQFSPIDSWA